MNRIRFGCQFYTWQMSGDRYVGALPHICEVIQRAGFSGIEPEVGMLGEYFDSSVRLKEVLSAHNLAASAFCLVCDWRGTEENASERRTADKLLDFMMEFQETHLVLCQMPGSDRSDLERRQRQVIACVNAVARRAAERGIACSYHPNSPAGSVFRTREDYHVMMNLLDLEACGYCPDSGHILMGGMDVYEVFDSYMSTIRHVHLKDITEAKEWAPMGRGVTDVPRLIEMLAAADYEGWVMVEEESAMAEIDPDGATLVNGEYVAKALR